MIDNNNTFVSFKTKDPQIILDKINHLMKHNYNMSINISGFISFTEIKDEKEYTITLDIVNNSCTS